MTVRRPTRTDWSKALTVPTRMLPSSATITPSPTAIARARRAPSKRADHETGAVFGFQRTPRPSASIAACAIQSSSGGPSSPGREGGVGLGAEGVQVIAHEVASEVDGAHALGLGVALLGCRGVGMRVAGRIAIGGGEHRGVDRAVDGKAEQAERLAERGGHGRRPLRAEIDRSAHHQGTGCTSC